LGYWVLANTGQYWFRWVYTSAQDIRIADVWQLSVVGDVVVDVATGQLASRAWRFLLPRVHCSEGYWQPGSRCDCMMVYVRHYTAFKAPGWWLLRLYHRCCMEKTSE